MIKKQVHHFREWIEDGLRRICGRMSPTKRLTLIIVMIALFGITNIYITTRAIYEIGEKDIRREMIEIEHIQQPEVNRDKTPEINNELIEDENEQRND